MVATAACFSHGSMTAPGGEEGQMARTRGSKGEVWSEEAEPEEKILRQGHQSGEGAPIWGGPLPQERQDSVLPPQDSETEQQQAVAGDPHIC